jgi:hypothetical protein
MNTPPYEYEIRLTCADADVAILRDALYYESRISPLPCKSEPVSLLHLDCDGEDVPLVLLTLALWAHDVDVDGVAMPRSHDLPLFVFTGNAGTFTLGIYGEATRLVTSCADTDPLRSKLARAVLDALAGEGGA